MELKNYQKAVIRDLERYLEILMKTKNIETDPILGSGRRKM